MATSVSYMPPTTTDAVADLSHWNAPVDFARAKADGIMAVILKCTQGSSFVDPTYAPRLAAAQAAGLLVAAYHFFDESGAAAQVAHFLATAGNVGVLVVDYEPTTAAGAPNPTPANQSELEAIVQAIHDQRGGRWPVVYAGRWMIKPGISAMGYKPAVHAMMALATTASVLPNCPLMLPEYGTSPVTPPGWDKWVLWQYTAQASMDWVGNAFDRSKFAGLPAELAAFWAGTIPKPTTAGEIDFAGTATDDAGGSWSLVGKLTKVTPATARAAVAGLLLGAAGVHGVDKITAPPPSVQVVEKAQHTDVRRTMCSGQNSSGKPVEAPCPTETWESRVEQPAREIPPTQPAPTPASGAVTLAATQQDPVKLDWEAWKDCYAAWKSQGGLFVHASQEHAVTSPDVKPMRPVTEYTRVTESPSPYEPAPR